MKSVLDVQQHSHSLEVVAFQQLKPSPKLPKIFPNYSGEFG